MGSPQATIQGYNFSMRLRYLRPPSQAGRLWNPSSSASLCPFGQAGLGQGMACLSFCFCLKEGHLRERGRDGRKRQSLLSCQTQNLRNKDQSFTLGEAPSPGLSFPLCKMGVTSTEAPHRVVGTELPSINKRFGCFWWKNTERGVEFEEVNIPCPAGKLAFLPRESGARLPLPSTHPWAQLRGRCLHPATRHPQLLRLCCWPLEGAVGALCLFSRQTQSWEKQGFLSHIDRQSWLQAPDLKTKVTSKSQITNWGPCININTSLLEMYQQPQNACILSPSDPLYKPYFKK